MNAKNIYTIISQDIITDAADNMNSIMKIIDTFGADISETDIKKNNIVLGEKPLMLPINYAVATSWDLGSPLKKDQILKVQVNFIDPEGKDLEGPTQEHHLTSGIDKVNINFKVQGFPFTKAGDYKLVSKITAGSKILATGEYSVKAVVNILK